MYHRLTHRQIKKTNITHFVRNRHDARQGHPWGETPHNPLGLWGLGLKVRRELLAQTLHLTLR